MKRVWLIAILILWFLNILIIGIMIGKSYRNQNSSLNVNRNHGLINYQDRTFYGRVKGFAIGITDASKPVFESIDDKWRAIFGFFTHPAGFGSLLNTIIPKKKTVTKVEKNVDLRLVAPDKSEIERESVSNLEINLSSPIPNDIEELPRKPHNYVRSDPFLDIYPKETVSKLQPTGKTGSKELNRTLTGNTAKEKADRETTVVPVKPNPLSKFKLRGIVISDQPMAYLESKEGYQKVTIGDSIAGGRVIEITQQAVTVLVESQPIVLTAEGSK